MRRRHLAVVLFLFLFGSVFVTGSVVLGATGGTSSGPGAGGGTEPGIAALTVQNVSLNDGIEGDFEGAEDEGVVTCTGVGPPPNHYSVSVRGRVEGIRDPDGYDLVGRIGDSSATLLGTGIRPDGEFLGTTTVEDDGSAVPGDDVTLTVALVDGEKTVDSVDRSVTVAEVDRRCRDET